MLTLLTALRIAATLGIGWVGVAVIVDAVKGVFR